MANEIRQTTTLSIVQGGLTETLTCDKQITMVGGAKDAHTVNLTTTGVKLVISAAVIAEGARWFSIKNPDAAISILVSLDNDVTYPITLLAGESMIVPLSVAPTVNPNIFLKCASSTIANVPSLITGR